MNLFDVVLLILIALGSINGYRKGFLFMLFALTALVLGVLAGIFLTNKVMVTIRPFLNVNDNWLPFISFLLIFAVTLLLVRSAGAITSWALHKTIFGTPDKLLGAFFGALKSAAWLGLLLYGIQSVMVAVPWWMEESLIYRALSSGLALAMPV